MPEERVGMIDARLRESWRWFAFAALIVVVDQAVKWIVLERFGPGERLVVTDFFNLVLVFNKGAAFSFLAQAGGWQTPVLVVFALVAAGIVSVLLVRSPGRRMLCTALALVLGGAVGNVIDRLRFGHVVDFLDFHAYGWHWPAFNVADSAITVGAGLLIVESFLHDDKRA
jgi:signal peptidase II